LATPTCHTAPSLPESSTHTQSLRIGCSNECCMNFESFSESAVRHLPSSELQHRARGGPQQMCAHSYAVCPPRKVWRPLAHSQVVPELKLCRNSELEWLATLKLRKLKYFIFISCQLISILSFHHGANLRRLNLRCNPIVRSGFGLKIKLSKDVICENSSPSRGRGRGMGPLHREQNSSFAELK
jgi:hypothetical protein